MLSQVRDDNTAACQLYERTGWQLLEVRAKVELSPWQDRLIIVITLQAAAYRPGDIQHLPYTAIQVRKLTVTPRRAHMGISQSIFTRSTVGN